MKRLVGMAKARQRKIMLVPVGINKWQPADIIQLVKVFFCQCQGQSAEILGECPSPSTTSELIAGSAAKPVPPVPASRHGRLDLDQAIDNLPQSFHVSDRWLVPPGGLATVFWRRAAASVLAGQKACGQRAPDLNAKILIDCKR